jgi:lipid II:glycine glycyltransferase (peptidoglycan interpeptide bridge formation enzyme)
MGTSIQFISRDQWRQIAPTFHDYNYCQLWDFGVACARRVGAVNEHVAIFEKDQIIGLADVRIKSIPLSGTGIAYINGGPSVRSKQEGDPDILRSCISELITEYVKRRNLVLRLRPWLGSEPWLTQQKRIFDDLGIIIQVDGKPYRTIVLDLSNPLDCLRKQLDQKWRNCLNNSEKRGMRVRTGFDDLCFSEFIGLFNPMISRKDFRVELNPEFYRELQKNLVAGERFLVTLVYEDDQAIAGHVSSILGDTCVYLLGASNDIGLKNKASYLVQWSVIQMAKERGCRFYDLGGIDPDKNPGVYHFKKGMGGVDVTAPGPYELFPNNISKNIVKIGEKVFRFIKQKSAKNRKS